MAKVILAVIVLSIHLCLAGTEAAAQPSHIVVIRHAEKPKDKANPHLSRIGVRRAERLASFIMRDSFMIRLGLPVAVFATKTTKGDNGQRTQETVAPLARALGVPVLKPYVGKRYAALARLVLTDRAYDGKTVFICWNHENIPRLASALGVTPEPPKWEDAVFDLVYVISYRDGRAALTTTQYGLQ
jgi:hypothetical protein